MEYSFVDEYKSRFIEVKSWNLDQSMKYWRIFEYLIDKNENSDIKSAFEIQIKSTKPFDL